MNPEDISRDLPVIPRLPPEPAKPDPHQFNPGQRIRDSHNRLYWVDQNHSLRRVEGGKAGKAARKAAKRRGQLKRQTKESQG